MTAPADAARADAVRALRILVDHGDERAAAALDLINTIPFAERNALIRNMAERFAGHLKSVRAKAAFIAKTADRYEAVVYPRHRRHGLPDHYRGTAEAIVYEILSRGGKFPSAQTIRATILTNHGDL